jgi:hypothetical protein
VDHVARFAGQNEAFLLLKALERQAKRVHGETLLHECAAVERGSHREDSLRNGEALERLVTER